MGESLIINFNYSLADFIRLAGNPSAVIAGLTRNPLLVHFSGDPVSSAN